MLLSTALSFPYLKVNNKLKYTNLLQCLLVVIIGVICQVGDTRGESTNDESKPKSAKFSKEEFSPFSNLEDSSDDITIERYRKVTAKYAYTRKFIINSVPPNDYMTTTEPIVSTAHMLTRKEHLERMKEIYEQYQTHSGSLPTMPPFISAVHFGKLDVRVGRISQIMIHPKSEKLYICDVDIGIGHPVKVITSLGKNIPIVQLIMEWVVVLVNIQPCLIMGHQSFARIITAVSSNAVDFLMPPQGSEPGDIVTVRGFPRHPFPVLNPVKRIYQSIRKYFKTNNESVACYRSVPWEVEGKGFVSAFNLPNVLVR